MWRKAIILLILLIFTLIALYKFHPAFRHMVYYQYFTLANPDVVGGPCGPNCNGYNEYPPERLGHVDTLQDFFINDTNRIYVSGVIHDFGGKPAPGILLYVFQANSAGIYPKTGKEKGADTLNGYLRAWLRTDEGGQYGFYTNRPGAYPGTKRMAHIHCIIKEPNLNAYSLPDFVFPDDPNLTGKARRTPQEENGGLVIKTGEDDGITKYHRHMYLGRNVVNHPAKK